MDHLAAAAMLTKNHPTVVERSHPDGPTVIGHSAVMAI